MNNRRTSESWRAGLVRTLGLILTGCAASCGTEDVVVAVKAGSGGAGSAGAGASGMGGANGANGTGATTQGGAAGSGGSMVGPGGQSGQAGGMSCTQSSECGATGYCDRVQCHDPEGQCRPRPLSCESDQGPVCGCDGITYWNDCLRQQYGVTSSVHDQCFGQQALYCDFQGPFCPSSDAYCGQLVPPGPECGPPQGGSCWVLPAQCPAPDGQSWERCGPPGPDSCTDLCRAVRSENRYRLRPGSSCE